MAFLLPLAIPAIANVATNLGVGVSNALQGDRSSVTVQLGKFVWTNNKGFRLQDLPFELRERIVLMALAESRSLILPPPVVLDPFAPLTPNQLEALQKRSPLHPSNPSYRCIGVGELRSANGYPLSAWRWLAISKEWWVVLRKELWRDLILGGMRPYVNFLRFLRDPDVHVLSFVQTLSLLDGFTHPSELYEILADPRLKNLMSISILPIFPFTSSPFLPPLSPFPFGIQAIPARNLQILALGLPLDTCTNPTSRTHLRTLALKQLGISLVRPTAELLAEVWALVGETCETLSVRYSPPIHRVGNQVHLEPLVDPLVLLDSPARNAPRLVFYLPRMLSLEALPFSGQPMDGGRATCSFSQRLVDLVSVDDELRDRVEIWLVGGAGGAFGELEAPELALAGADASENERLFPPVIASHVRLDPDERVLREAGRRRSDAAELDHRNKEVWERQTDLRLGGLFGLRMESKKTH